MQHLGLAVCLPAVFAMALAGRPPRAEPKEMPRYTHREIFDAIWWVESGGRLHPPDGDAGMSIGPYQIQRIYWIDSRVPGRYEDCRRRDYAETVITAFMERWVPEAWQQGNAEVIARIHNGGPRGMQKKATLRYWRKVKRRLRKLAAAR